MKIGWVCGILLALKCYDVAISVSQDNLEKTFHYLREAYGKNEESEEP